MNKLHLAIFTHNYPDSINDRQNAGIFVYDIAQQLQSFCNVTVFCPGNKNKKEKIGKVDVQWFEWRGDKLGQLKIWKLNDFLSLTYFLIKGQKEAVNLIKADSSINAVLSMWAFPAGLFALKVRREFGIPYVVWALGSDIYVYGRVPILKNVIKNILWKADMLFADGIDLANKTSKLAGKKCYFLPSSSKFNNETIQNEYKKNKNKITLSFLGRLEKVKGPDVLIDALIKNKENISGYEIHIMGDGSLSSDLKNKASKNNLSESIIFHGNVHDPSKIKNILSISDWLIIPSRSDSIPLVFSESMKTGTPIIASNLPDLKYLVKKYHIGYFFKTENANSLSKILTQLSSKKSDRNIFHKNTKKVAKEFSIEESSKNLISIFKKIIHE